MTFRYFLKIHLLFCALLFSCNVFSSPVISPSTGSSIPLGSQFDWSDTDVGSDYWVYVGTSPGARDILDSGNISNQMSFIVGDWPGEFFVRLWYRPIGMAWAFVDTRFTSASCPAPVREQYDMIKERVDNGVLVQSESNFEPFDGSFCKAQYGVVGEDVFDYVFTIVVQADGFEEVDVVPARVTGRGLTLWVTKSEARACVNYIDC